MRTISLPLMLMPEYLNRSQDYYKVVWNLKIEGLNLRCNDQFELMLILERNEEHNFIIGGVLLD